MSDERSRERASANVDLVQGMFEAVVDADVRGAVELLDPEVEIYSTPALANAGTYHGVSGFLRWAERWFDAWEEFEIRVGLYEPVGERHVVATCRQVGRGKGSGATVEMDAAYLCEVSGGLVVRFHLYATRDEAIAEARRGEEGPP